MKVEIEVWRSSENQNEIHLFLADERNTYLVGWNPNAISSSTVLESLPNHLDLSEVRKALEIR